MRNNKGQFTNMREDVTGQKFNHLTANCRWVTHKVNANNRKRKYVNSEVNNQIAQG